MKMKITKEQAVNHFVVHGQCWWPVTSYYERVSHVEFVTRLVNDEGVRVAGLFGYHMFRPLPSDYSIGGRTL